MLGLLGAKVGEAPFQFFCRRSPVLARPISGFTGLFGPRTKVGPPDKEGLVAEHLTQKVYVVFDEQVARWDRGIPAFVQKVGPPHNYSSSSTSCRRRSRHS